MRSKTSGSSNEPPASKKLKRSKKNAPAFADIAPEQSLKQHKMDLEMTLLTLDKVQITKVSVSNKHALALTNAGTVYGWGDNEHA